MTNPTQPDQALVPKYTSICHDASVEVRKNVRIKYYCTQCGKPCIARKNR